MAVDDASLQEHTFLRNDTTTTAILGRFRFHCPLRTAKSNREKGCHVDEAPCAAERKRRQKEAGVTGECIFFDLCGFDPVKDMVIDAMHAVILNLVRRPSPG